MLAASRGVCARNAGTLMQMANIRAKWGEEKEWTQEATNGDEKAGGRTEKRQIEIRLLQQLNAGTPATWW
jgi:hypothetical protein